MPKWTFFQNDFRKGETLTQWYITSSSMFHFDFSWEFLFCLVPVCSCSAESPNGTYVEAHIFFAQYLPVAKLPGLIHFILPILEATEPAGWMATFSFQAVLGKKIGQCWFPVRPFPCLNTKSSGQLIKPYILPALLCRHMHVVGLCWHSAAPCRHRKSHHQFAAE